MTEVSPMHFNLQATKLLFCDIGYQVGVVTTPLKFSV